MYTMISTKTHILKMYLFGYAESSCCVGFSLGVASRGYSPVAVHEFLIAVASLVVGHGLVVGMQASVIAAHALSSGGSWALGHGLNRCGTQA